MSRRFATACCLILTAFVLTALMGCGSSAKPYVNPASVGTVSGGIPEPTSTAGAKSFSSPGQKIYATGVGTGGSILRLAPQAAQGAMLMGGGGCAACHGTDGKGGKAQVANGSAINSPDVTYANLKKLGYTDATIASSIMFSTDEAGLPLDDTMPSWQMSSKDVAATIAYLKTLK